MLSKDPNEPTAQQVTDDIEIAPLPETQHSPHHDQHVEYTHELTDDASEATSRWLIRIVPFAYGGLLGALAENFALGLALGGLASAAFDLHMGENSVLRPASRGLFDRGCPLIAAMAGGLATSIRRLGLRPPAILGRVDCGTART